MNAKVDAFIDRAKRWGPEFAALRALALDAKLTEELKWGVPCYTFNDQNVVLIHGFKEYCALLFFKGVLMQDPDAILVQQTENVQAGRQIRFTSLAQIKKMAPVLKTYLKEAIRVEKSGQQVPYKETADFAFPDELQAKMDEVPALQEAFDSLTPGRQRAYLLHFSSAKQAKTRVARIEKCVQRILDRKGLDD